MRTKKQIKKRIATLTKKVEKLHKAWKYHRCNGRYSLASIFLESACQKQEAIKHLKWSIRK